MKKPCALAREIWEGTNFRFDLFIVTEHIHLHKDFVTSVSLNKTCQHTASHMLVFNLSPLGVVIIMIHHFGLFPTIIANYLSFVPLMNKSSKATPTIVCFRRLFDLWRSWEKSNVLLNRGDWTTQFHHTFSSSEVHGSSSSFVYCHSESKNNTLHLWNTMPQAGQGHKDGKNWWPFNIHDSWNMHILVCTKYEHCTLLQYECYPFYNNINSFRYMYG